jgi:hypothetical protein
MENFMYQLWKRYNDEYVHKKYSFLYNVIVEGKVSIITHCVLLVVDIQYNEVNDLFAIEVSDGHYSIFSTNITSTDPLYGIIKTQKITIGDKIHSIGAELVQSEKLSNKILSEYRIKLHYNQIAKGLNSSVLGIHKKGYLYKSVSSLSPYGGPIFMLDVILKEKIIQEESVIMKVADYLNKEELKIHIARDKINGVKEGMRMKIFNVVAIVGENNSLEVKAFIQKRGMEVLFFIYKSTACSLMQTREQRRAYEVEMNEIVARKSIVSAEVNDCVAENYIKKLDSIIQSYDSLISMCEAFVCALSYIIPIAEEFISNPEFNQDFYEKLFHIEFGRLFTLRLLKILELHLIEGLTNSEMMEKYIVIINSIFIYLGITQLPHEDERSFTLNIIELLQDLITKTVISV